MWTWLRALKNYFEPPQQGRVEYKYYARTGNCHNCGQCCSEIHLIHGEEVIRSEEQFEKLKARHEDYRHFIPVGQSSAGLTFRCSKLTPENTCGIYEDRPLFCRKYPSEATLLFGGNLAPQCGYAFEAKQTFDAVLDKAFHKKTLKPGKLLNDVLPSTVIARAPDAEAR